MLERLAIAGYRRHGGRYPLLALRLLYAVSHGVVILGVLLLGVYQPLSPSEFWSSVLVIELLLVIDNALAMRDARRRLAPAEAWLGGDRAPDAAATAWRALAGLPAAAFRSLWWRAYVVQVIPFCAFLTWLLGLGVGSFALLLAGGTLVVVYGFFLRFFAMEAALRPVLEDASGDLADDADLSAAAVPVRWKLLAGPPAIAVITGVVVAGLSHGGATGLDAFGVDAMVALIVAFTISLELSLLLARSLLSPIDYFMTATRRVRDESDLGARVPVVSADEIGVLSQSFNEMVAGLEEKELLQEAFGAYVDPEVADRVRRDGTVLEGEEVEVSVLFLDIRDFTAFAERSSAREVVDRLNGFFELVVPVLVRHGGHANKFVGDGLLGVFGAPDRRPDHADRAVAAAIEIARLVRDRYRGDLRVGIGVNSGPVVAGTIGGGGRVEFTVIGDAVNTAARVEGATRETDDEVLVTEATRDLLTRPFPGGFDERAPVPLRGKTERVRLFAPREPGRGAAPSPSAADEVRAARLPG
ncbi:MAG: adenylate/guanylate cyclase domain-containing protein [Solirubrobacteraceae bacterium]